MTNPVDIGRMLALFMRMQQEQLRRRFISNNSAVMRRRLGRDMSDLFLKILRITKPDLACEIGAHEGTFSRRMKKAMPDSRVIAFEANPTVFDMHRRDLETSGVEFHQMCVADRPGTTQLKVPVRDDTSLQPSENLTGAAARQGWPGHGKPVTTMGSRLDYTPASQFELFDCETVSLDGFLSASPFRRGALWVDVEGAASQVFEGARLTLEKCVAIYVELENQTRWTGQQIDSDVYRPLFSSGFVPVLADLQKSWQYNAILLRWDVLEVPRVRREILRFLSTNAGSGEPD